MPSSLRSSSGIVYVFLATIGWSLSGVFVRLMPGLDGWQINCWRGLWMSIALLLYLLLMHRDRAMTRFDEIPFSVVMISALAFAVGTTFYVSSLTLVSTATVSVIGATSPLITGLLSPWITKERPHLSSWVSAGLALVGMFIIAKAGLEAGSMLGLALSFGVPITFALQTLLLRKYRDHDMMMSICVGGLFSFMFAGLGSVIFGQGSAFNISSHDFLLLLLMGPLQLALPLILYGLGAKSIPAITLALVSMLDAVFNP
ncbi:MAG: DMT family transporter, partial [Aestuariivirga sp.]